VQVQEKQQQQQKQQTLLQLSIGGAGDVSRSANRKQ
jgi:hypothetical protein